MTRRPAITEERDRERDVEPGLLWRRLAWFAGIWVASVAALGAVAYALRAWIGA